MAHANERSREIRRRRKRTKKYRLLARKAQKATLSEKSNIAAKIRRMSVGGNVVVAAMGLEER